MKNLRHSFSGFVVGILVMTMTISGYAAYQQSISVTYNDIKLSINGQIQQLKDANGNYVEPFTYNGTTFLPVRSVGEAVGYNVSWDQASSTVHLNGGAPGGGGGGGSTPGTTTPPSNVKMPLFDLDAFGINSMKEENSVLIGGVEYRDSFKTMGAYGGSTINYNLQGEYSTLSGVIGYVQGGNLGDEMYMQVFGDGTLIKEFTVPHGGIAADFSINVEGVSSLLFTTPGTDHSSMVMAIGTPVLSK